MKALIITILCSIIGMSSFGQNGTATVEGHFDFLNNSDTVYLIIYKYGHYENIAGLQTTYKTAVNNGSFKFNITTCNYPQYFDVILSKRSERNAISLLIETDDRIFMEGQIRNYQYSGDGARKINVLKKINEIFSNNGKLIQHGNPAHIKEDFEIYDTIAIKQIKYLDSNRTLISNTVYNLIKARIIGDNMGKGYYIRTMFPGQKSTPYLQALSGYKENIYLIKQTETLSSDPLNLVHTDYYTQCLLNKYIYDNFYRYAKSFELSEAYNVLKDSYRGVLRDNLITLLLKTNRNSKTDKTVLVNDALNFVKEEDFRTVLLQMKLNSLTGSDAYNFVLTDTNDNARTYKEFKNRAVLIDFWYTGCPNCPQITPFMKRFEKEYEGKPITFISVSIDKKKETWKNSINKGIYTSEKAINLYTQGWGKEHPIITRYGIQAYPALILIDPKGRIINISTDPRQDNGKVLNSLIANALKIE